MTGARFAIFLSVILSIWGLIHAYVFWRIASIPWIVAHVGRKTLFVSAGILWLSYVIARVVGSRKWEAIANTGSMAAT